MVYLKVVYCIFEQLFLEYFHLFLNNLVTRNRKWIFFYCVHTDKQKKKNYVAWKKRCVKLRNYVNGKFLIPYTKRKLNENLITLVNGKTKTTNKSSYSIKRIVSINREHWNHFANNLLFSWVIYAFNLCSRHLKSILYVLQRKYSSALIL